MYLILMVLISMTLVAQMIYHDGWWALVTIPGCTLISMAIISMVIIADYKVKKFLKNRGNGNGK